MKPIRSRLTWPVLMLALFLARLGWGQELQQTTTPDRETVVAAARQIMQAARYCSLITVGQDGHPQARVVDPFVPDEDMTVWIGTNPVTRKVAQIRRDPRVTLFYFDPQSLSYVTLLGTARVVDDRTEKARHWKDEWARFYHDGNRGDDYVLLRVTPHRLEVVSESRGLLNDPATWAPVAVEFD